MQTALLAKISILRDPRKIFMGKCVRSRRSFDKQNGNESMKYYNQMVLNIYKNNIGVVSMIL